MGEEKVKPKKFFISYDRKNAQKLAFKLEKDLKKEGYKVWLGKREIEPGEYWEQEIEDGIFNAEIFIKNLIYLIEMFLKLGLTFILS